MHNKPEVRKSWENHATNCFKIWVKNIRSIRVSDTVFFKNQYITMPEMTKADATVTAAQHMIKVLENEILTSIGETDKKQLT